jgi:hypothetical protein
MVSASLFATSQLKGLPVIAKERASEMQNSTFCSEKKKNSNDVRELRSLRIVVCRSADKITFSYGDLNLHVRAYRRISSPLSLATLLMVRRNGVNALAYSATLRERLISDGDNEDHLNPTALGIVDRQRGEGRREPHMVDAISGAGFDPCFADGRRDQ